MGASLTAGRPRAGVPAGFEPRPPDRCSPMVGILPEWPGLTYSSRRITPASGPGERGPASSPVPVSVPVSVEVLAEVLAEVSAWPFAASGSEGCTSSAATSSTGASSWVVLSLARPIPASGDCVREALMTCILPVRAGSAGRSGAAGAAGPLAFAPPPCGDEGLAK